MRKDQIKIPQKDSHTYTAGHGPLRSVTPENPGDGCHRPFDRVSPVFQHALLLYHPPIQEEREEDKPLHRSRNNQHRARAAIANYTRADKTPHEHRGEESQPPISLGVV